MYSVALGYTRLYSATLGYTQLHSVTLGYNSAALGYTRRHSAQRTRLHSVTRLHWAVLDYTQLHSAITRLHWAILGYTQLHSVTLGCTRLHKWQSAQCTRLHSAVLFFGNIYRAGGCGGGKQERVGGGQGKSKSVQGEGNARARACRGRAMQEEECAGEGGQGKSKSVQGEGNARGRACRGRAMQEEECAGEGGQGKIVQGGRTKSKSVQGGDGYIRSRVVKRVDRLHRRENLLKRLGTQLTFNICLFSNLDRPPVRACLMAELRSSWLGSWASACSLLSMAHSWKRDANWINSGPGHFDETRAAPSDTIFGKYALLDGLSVESTDSG